MCTDQEKIVGLAFLRHISSVTVYSDGYMVHEIGFWVGSSPNFCYTIHMKLDLCY